MAITFQRIGKFFKLSNRNIFEIVDNKNFQFAVMKIIETLCSLFTEFHKIQFFEFLINHNIFKMVDNSNKNVPIYYNKDK